MSNSRDASAYEVYGLFTRTESGEKSYFYVGKTRRTVQQRIREHILRAPNAHEDVYAYIRHLDEAGVQWESDVLRHCDANEYAPDAERIEVIRLLRLNHWLQNMRYGDASHQAELMRQVNDPAIRDVADVAAARVCAARVLEARKRRKLRHKELLERPKKTEILSVQACKLLSDVTRKRLLLACAGADMSLYKGYSLEELIHQARNYRVSEKILTNLRSHTSEVPVGPVRMVKKIRATVAGLAD
jgi:hypothetical protein